MRSINDLTDNLRKLAKSEYYQSLYNQVKEINLKMFANDYDLTYAQITFLTYLAFYHTIYTDIAIGEVKDNVLENNIYEDAYMYFKREDKPDKEKYNVHKRPQNMVPRKVNRNIETRKTKSQWVFETPEDV